MNTRLRTAAVTLLASVALLAGCADADSDSGEESAGSPASASSTPATAAPSLPPLPDTSPSIPTATTSGKAADGQITVTGTKVDGVEPGCVLLKTADKEYLLVGGDRDVIQRSSRLTVTGTPQPDLMSTCQQGIPFQVASVRAG